MQHETVGPGTVLAGRYRVDDLLSHTEQARCWRAIDEVLARPVAVHVLSAEDSRAGQLLEAARRSSMVPDGRFVRVLDAADEGGSVYVVREWVAGETLDVALASGPLPAKRSAWIARECAAAVAAAHDVGIPHLRLVPSSLVLTASGGVKILGLATDAALHGLTSRDPQDDDVRALGNLLYACLVARWPGSPVEGLPAAPDDAGRVLRPRQVRAGVPTALDDLCGRILGQPSRAGGAALRTAAQVSTALSAILTEMTDVQATLADAGPAPALRSAPQPPSSATTAIFSTTAAAMPPSELPAGQPRPAADPLTPAPPHFPAQGGGSPSAGAGRNRLLIWAAVAALVLGAAVLAYEIGRRGADATVGPDGTPSTSTSSEITTQPSAQPVEIAAVSDFDPVADGGSGEENASQAPLAVDGDPATAWETVQYFDNPELGGLKPGVGLLVDLGQPVDVSTVRLRLLGTGTSLELRAAPEASTSAPESADGFQIVAERSLAGERLRLELNPAVTTRFLLVYLTSLPEDSPTRYRGRIAEVTVLG